MKKNTASLWLAATLACIVSCCLKTPAILRFFCGFSLIYFLPGFAFTNLIFSKDEISPAERFCTSFGFSIGFSCISFLWAYYLFPKVTFPVMALILGATATLGTLLCFLKKSSAADKNILAKDFYWLLIILGVSIFFRFTYLGYSDYQGDEAHYSLKPAIEALQGDKDALITMEKPPTATILPALHYLFFNTFNESITRFPFAFYGVLGVLAMYLLGCQLAGSRIGLLAASFAALNGFLIVFSRLAQYQAIVVYSVILSLLFMHKFVKASAFPAQVKYLSAAVFFSGFGVFTHYDGFFVLPAITFMYLYKWFTGTLKKPVLMMFFSFLLFFIVTLPFYIPFILHPNFMRTVHFYQGERFRGFWHFHWPTLKDGGSFYNSKDYFWSILVLSILGLFRKWKHEIWVILSWFLPSFIFLMIICSKPNTHIHNFFIPMCVFSALGIDNLLRFTPRSLRSPALLHVISGLFLLAGGILALNTGRRVHKLFIRHHPEFLWSRAYDSVPHYGIFGFPYHRGWKTAGYLFRTGKLQGSYNSNEKSKISRFYLQQNPDKNFRYFIAVENPQSWDQNPQIPEGFAPLYRIFSKNGLLMTIYEKGALSCIDLDAGEYDRHFEPLDRAPSKV